MPKQPRRSLARAPIALLTIILAALLAVLPAGGDLDVAAKNKKKSKTITRSFNNAAEIATEQPGPADPFPSVIQVGGFKKGKIKDVNVVLRALEHHTFPDDIDVLLVAPGGESAFIMSDVGTNAEIGGVILTLDDEAAAPLPDASPLLSGTFQPTNGDPEFNGDDSVDDFPPPAPQPGGSELSVFDGTNPNGQWQLFVVDDKISDFGFFRDGWSLQITARVKNKKK